MPFQTANLLLYAILPFVSIVPLLAVIYILKITLLKKSPLIQPPQNEENEPNIDILEEKLNQLIKNNQEQTHNKDLHQELNQSTTHTITSYLKLNTHNLKKSQLFRLIITLIRNKEDDDKIIRIMRHYLPNSSTSHLYAILHSVKLFLHISLKDGQAKQLINDLNNNKIKSTLFYLEKKLNHLLNQIPQVPPSLQTLLIDEATRLGLIFATFSEFYSSKSTKKILELVTNLSPNLVKHWHTPPKKENPKEQYRQHLQNYKKNDFY